MGFHMVHLIFWQLVLELLHLGLHIVDDTLSLIDCLYHVLPQVNTYKYIQYHNTSK